MPLISPTYHHQRPSAAVDQMIDVHILNMCGECNAACIRGMGHDNRYLESPLQAFRFMVGPGHCSMVSKYDPSLSKAVSPVDPIFLVVKNLTLIKIFILQRVYELLKTESTCRLSIQ